MTREMPKIDVEEALRDPKAFFTEPQDVVAHPQLSREHKLAILRRWEQDARRQPARSRASGTRALVALRQ
jgi:hypothetical protein